MREGVGFCYPPICFAFLTHYTHSNLFLCSFCTFSTFYYKNKNNIMAISRSQFSSKKKRSKLQLTLVFELKLDGIRFCMLSLYEANAKSNLMINNIFKHDGYAVYGISWLLMINSLMHQSVLLQSP